MLLHAMEAVAQDDLLGDLSKRVADICRLVVSKWSHLACESEIRERLKGNSTNRIVVLVEPSTSTDVFPFGVVGFCIYNVEAVLGEKMFDIQEMFISRENCMGVGVKDTLAGLLRARCRREGIEILRRYGAVDRTSLSKYSIELHESHLLNCEKCGACCRGDREVVLEAEDLGEGIMCDPYRPLLVRRKDGGACYYLGVGNRCAIFESRPKSCRSFLCQREFGG